MSSSATNAYWDPFAGASELLRLVFGDTFSVPDERDELGTPPVNPLASSSSSLQFSKSVVKVDVTPPAPKQKIGVRPVHFRDFIGVADDSDPDLLVLWQLKEKYRGSAPSKFVEAINGSTPSLLASSSSQPREFMPGAGQKETSSEQPDGQKVSFTGWEPSEGDSLPLVNISFDSSILRPGQTSIDTSKDVQSRPNVEVRATVPTQPTQSVQNLEKAFKESLITTNSYTATAAESPDGAPRFQHAEPLPFVEKSAIPAAQINLFSTRTSTPSSSEHHSAIMVPNATRKLHGLVPPHLARSITRNTMKAREDESLRLRLQQQEGVRLPQGATQVDNGAQNVRNVEKPAPQRQNSGEIRGPSFMQAPLNDSRPYTTPPYASAPSTALPDNVTHFTTRPPLAIARQVSISLPMRATNNVPMTNFSNHNSIPSVVSQVPVTYKNQGPARPFTAGTTIAGTLYNAPSRDMASKENEPINVAQQPPNSQLNFQPLSMSNLANTDAASRSSPTEALRTLKRAWSDAEVGHVGVSAQLEKRPRLL